MHCALSVLSSALPPPSPCPLRGGREGVGVIPPQGAEGDLRGFFLVLGLPLGIGHSIDKLSSFLIAHLDPSFLGGLTVPLRKTIAAESCQIHQIDILNLSMHLQMVHQAT